MHADPDGIHKIHHSGPRYQVDGPHLAAPSPQRTPVLFQAGNSQAGMEFAARNAEAVFMFAGSPDSAGKVAKTVRSLASGFGRLEDDLLLFAGLSFVVGSTEAEARGARTRPTPPCRWKGWPGTFREKLFDGSGPRLNTRHPATHHRGAFRDASK